MKSWEEMNSDEELRHKPRIIGFVESFEKKHKDDLPDEHLFNAGCMAVALYLFGPLEEEEITLYASVIKKRVSDYRNSLH